MNKNQTVGKIGENIVKRIFNKYKIEYTDLIKKKIKQTIIVNSSVINYQYNRYSLSHPFDLIVNNNNIEIKTSRLNKNNEFMISFIKNRIDLVDFVIVVILNEQKKLKYFHLLKKEDFNKYKAMKVNTDKFKAINSFNLAKIVKNI